jgi:hypothetical protein
MNALVVRTFPCFRFVTLAIDWCRRQQQEDAQAETVRLRATMSQYQFHPVVAASPVGPDAGHMAANSILGIFAHACAADG